MSAFSERPRRDRNYRLLAPRSLMNQLKADSPLRDIFESPEDVAHQAWLQNITDRVNRRLGNR